MNHCDNVPDIIGYNLRILFCGINPGLISGQTGHHFARPGNKFWKALYLGGLTDRIWLPEEGRQLPTVGIGIINFVNRVSASAQELSLGEIRTGAKQVTQKVLTYRPQTLAILGVGAYRDGFGKPKAQIGLQTEIIGGTAIWVLPNPSGLNAHYQADAIGELFKKITSHSKI